MSSAQRPAGPSQFRLSRRTTVVLAGSLLFFVTICLLLTLLPRLPLLVAKQRWQRRPFERYRVKVEFNTIYKNCYYDVEVNRFEVTRIYQNWCDQLGEGFIEPLDPLTIDELFEKLIADQNKIYCSPAGCRCGNPVINEISWDREWGHPSQWIRKEAELPFGFEPLGPCIVEYPFREIGRIVSLEPVP